MDKCLCYSTHLQERPLIFIGVAKLSYFVNLVSQLNDFDHRDCPLFVIKKRQLKT